MFINYFTFMNYSSILNWEGLDLKSFKKIRLVSAKVSVLELLSLRCQILNFFPINKFLTFICKTKLVVN